MIWKIAKKEFLLNLMTFKFAVGMILCVVLMAVFMPVLVNDYQRQLKDYNTNVAANEAELRKVHVYKNITPTIYRPPNVLSVFSEGIDKHLKSSEKIRLGSISNERRLVNNESTNLLSILPVLDISLIFKIIVSVLALLMVYDVISGETEQGTLKLILSGTISRPKVLLGKLIAGLLTLAVPITIMFIVVLLILQFSSMVSLSGLDWIRIFLMYIVTLIFISVIFNFGLFISCLSKKSAISLILGLFLWLIFVALIPNASAYLASQLRPVESQEQFQGKIKAVIEERSSKINELTKNIKGGGSQSDAPGAFGQVYIKSCNKSFMVYNQRRYPITEPVKIKYTSKIFEIKQKYHNRLVKQKLFAENISRSSPMIIYENIMSVLACTDLENFENYTSKVQGYRKLVANYIASKTDNFHSPSYFTESCEEVQFKADTPLNLGDFPTFSYQPVGIAKSFHEIIPDLMSLILMNAFFFMLSFVVFLKYDVR